MRENSDAGCHAIEVCGVISVSDTLKEEAVHAVKMLKQKNLRVIMLTGDNPRTAQAIAKRVGIHEVFVEMLPQEKVDVVQSLVERGKRVVMVGGWYKRCASLCPTLSAYCYGSYWG